MNNRLKQELEKIEIPKELHERSKFGIQSAASEMKGRSKMRKIIKPLGSVAAATVLVMGLLAMADPGFTSSLNGFFKDITNWNGAVIGTEYNQATEEIDIKLSNLTVLGNELILPLSVTFEQADKLPYNSIEALTLREFKVESGSKIEVTADQIRVEPALTKEYSFDIEDSQNLLSEVESKDSTVREFEANLVINKELLGSDNTFTLIIDSLYGYNKGDSPLEIKGNWKLDFPGY